MNAQKMKSSDNYYSDNNKEFLASPTSNKTSPTVVDSHVVADTDIPNCDTVTSDDTFTKTVCDTVDNSIATVTAPVYDSTVSVTTSATVTADVDVNADSVNMSASDAAVQSSSSTTNNVLSAAEASAAEPPVSLESQFTQPYPVEVI